MASRSASRLQGPDGTDHEILAYPFLHFCKQFLLILRQASFDLENICRMSGIKHCGGHWVQILQQCFYFDQSFPVAGRSEVSAPDHLLQLRSGKNCQAHGDDPPGPTSAKRWTSAGCL